MRELGLDSRKDFLRNSAHWTQPCQACLLGAAPWLTAPRVWDAQGTRLGRRSGHKVGEAAHSMFHLAVK